MRRLQIHTATNRLVPRRDDGHLVQTLTIADPPERGDRIVGDGRGVLWGTVEVWDPESGAAILNWASLDEGDDDRPRPSSPVTFSCRVEVRQS